MFVKSIVVVLIFYLLLRCIKIKTWLFEVYYFIYESFEWELWHL